MKNFIYSVVLLLLVANINIYSQENRQEESRRDNRQEDVRGESRYNEDHRHTRSIKAELILRLEKLERDYSRLLGRRDRAALGQQIEEIKELIRQMPPEPVYVPEPQPMSEMEFKELYNSVKKQHFKDQRAQVIRASAGYNFFTIEQVKTLANTTSFSDERLDIIIILYPRIINYNKTFQLYECLTFDTEKMKLEQFIKDYETQHQEMRNRRD